MATREEMHEFALVIEDIVCSTDYNYIEAIVEYCNKTGMEIEVASTLISKALKDKIAEDARNLNLLPKISQLPL